MAALAAAAAPELIAVGPIGWAILGVAVVGLAGYGVYKAVSAANESFSDKQPGSKEECPSGAKAVSGGESTQSPVGWPGNDPAAPPADGWEWKGKGPPGSGQGNWVGPEGESLHPDLDHPDPIGEHWDYKDPASKWWRIFPDGTMSPK